MPTNGFVQPFVGTISFLSVFHGGKKGIRTLERVLAVTRFPIVRFRPTQPSFRRSNNIFNLIIIPRSSEFVKYFFEKICKAAENRGQRHLALVLLGLVLVLLLLFRLILLLVLLILILIRHI